ncbi:MAG TPA: patatin-like phospholipase family protein [Smithella sp.]|nr:patatin-like phospholipase family protein [Smithella sp.]
MIFTLDLRTLDLSNALLSCYASKRPFKEKKTDTSHLTFYLQQGKGGMMSKVQISKKALVVEGGGMRGVFAAGVLNAFGSAGFDPFDMYLGVSAGACNLASHLAGQNDRNFDIIERYSIDGRFINWGRFLRGGHLMDLDWLWEQTIDNRTFVLL